jgi:hypothetical protein
VLSARGLGELSRVRLHEARYRSAWVVTNYPRSSESEFTACVVNLSQSECGKSPELTASAIGTALRNQHINLPQLGDDLAAGGAETALQHQSSALCARLPTTVPAGAGRPPASSKDSQGAKGRCNQIGKIYRSRGHRHCQ